MRRPKRWHVYILFSLKKIGASIWLLEPLLGKAPPLRSLERLFPERGWKHEDR
jgi:hypothetical protein